MIYRIAYHWRRFWVKYNGPRGFGRVASRFAAWLTSPYQGRAFLANLTPQGYISFKAYMIYPDLTLGKHIFIGEFTTLTCGGKDPAAVSIGDHAQLYGDIFMQTGHGAGIHIGEHTHIQPHCHFRACVEDIVIGKKVEIASNCAFYSFNHCVEPDVDIMDQPLTSKGPIRIGDGAWLGHGVVVLNGVTIGEGAIVGASSVVTQDIPANAIAVGSPARVIRYRGDS